MSTSWTWDHKSQPIPRRARPDAAPAESSRRSRLRERLTHTQDQVEFLVETLRESWKARADALLLRGPERHEGKDLSCLYVGAGDNLEHLRKLMFRETPESTSLGGSHALLARRLVAQHEARANVVVVDLSFPFDRLFGGDDYLKTLSWVNQSISIGDSWEELQARLKSGVKRNHAQRARKHGLVARVTHDEESAKAFYREMYVPHIHRKFGAAAVLEPEDKVCWCCREHGLLEVASQGEVLGASVLTRVGTRLKSVWSATRDGLDNQTTSAVFGALYHFTLVHAYEQGCEVVDYCTSRSNLNDGVLVYKRQWGARVHRAGNRDAMLLRPRDFSAPTLSFFVKNPFLVDHGQAFAARFLSTNKALHASELEALVDQHSMEGVEHFEFCSTHGFEQSAIDWATRDPRVRLRDLSSAKHPTRDFCSGA